MRETEFNNIRLYEMRLQTLLDEIKIKQFVILRQNEVLEALIKEKEEFIRDLAEFNCYVNINKTGCSIYKKVNK